MPRRKIVVKRDIIPDPKYNSPLVARFANCLMLDGKKSLSQNILYSSLDIIENQTGQEGFAVFQQALNNVKPVIEIRPRRVGGQTYQIPVDVKAERRTALAIRWVIQAARARGEKTMDGRLAGELLDAFKNDGAAIRKKQEQHRMAEANRAFAHYRW
jgi:small subunit ribosomal protein S7